MSYLKTFAKIVTLSAIALWCVASSGAAQTPQQQPPSKPAAAKHSSVRKHAPRARAARKMAAAKTQAGGGIAVRPVPKAKAGKSASPSMAAAVRPTELPELTHGRDPFAALIHESDPNGHTNLPPGIAGLQVATIQLQGMVKTADGMVAVVANPQDRVYFLHDGDHIYDGVVEKIGLDDITFRQESKDAFGRTVERDVSKRLYPIAGDAQ